ncbi:MAG: hypothetical protein HY017_29440 [Betaproteobacteria bacterium]|nr:hypothetical protein [Betaproteobacteria bacterium]
MTTPITELQVQSELAEDIIGTYIGRLSADRARAEAAERQSPSTLRLSIILWLRAELRNAGLDRANLFEYRADPNRLKALVELYEQKLFALAEAKQRAAVQSAIDDKTFLRAVLDATARSETA